MAAITPGYLATYRDCVRVISQPLTTSADSHLGKRKRESKVGKSKEEDDLALERHRFLNDMKLKATFEHIFAKYGRDFADGADEVDLVTGDVVTDNGHLKHLRMDLDLGRAHGGRLVAMLKHEAGDADVEDELSCNELPADHDQDDVWGDDSEASSECDEAIDDEHLDASEDSADHLPDYNLSLNPDEEVGEYSTNKDIWNDLPKLPGDEGYDPFADSSGEHGTSSNVLEQFQSGVSDQVTQLVEALQRAQEAQGGQATAGLKPQITIDLDPASATYGKPVITYAKTEKQKQQPVRPAMQVPKPKGTHTQKKQKRIEEQPMRPKDVATNVLMRIAEAGLPTVPGPDGTFPPLKRDRPEQKDRQSQKGFGSDTGNVSNPKTSDNCIDATLETAAAIENQLEVAEAVGHDGHDQIGASTYSANTARTLDRRFLPPGTPWSEEDDELIVELKDNRNIGWGDIRDLCFPDRRVSALQYRYYTYLKTNDKKQFSDEEHELLRQLKDEDRLSWADIQRDYFPELRITQLQYRYQSAPHKVHEKSTPWTQERDELLAELKDRQGLTWKQILEEHFPDMKISQIQHRYYTIARPADWKERAIALTEAFDKAEKERQKEAPAAGSRSRPKREDKGSPIWLLRRRLQGASDKANEGKRRLAAEKKAKQDELKRREAARLAAQEEKRLAREAVTIAKLKAIRDEKEQRELTRRDIASVSPVPEATEDAFEPATSSTLMDQFHVAIDEYEDYQLPERALGGKICRRLLHAEYEERRRRQAQRQVFEQALDMGFFILPKPAEPSATPAEAAVTDTLLQTWPSSLDAPVANEGRPCDPSRPWLPAIDERLPCLDTMRSRYSMIYPIDVRMYAPAPPLPLSYMHQAPSTPSSEGNPAVEGHDSAGALPDEGVNATLVATEDCPSLSATPAVSIGPMSKIWVLPKQNQSIENPRLPSLSPEPSIRSGTEASEHEDVAAANIPRLQTPSNNRASPVELQTPSKPTPALLHGHDVNQAYSASLIVDRSSSTKDIKRTQAKLSEPVEAHNAVELSCSPVHSNSGRRPPSRSPVVLGPFARTPVACSPAAKRPLGHGEPGSRPSRANAVARPARRLSKRAVVEDSESDATSAMSLAGSDGGSSSDSASSPDDEDDASSSEDAPTPYGGGMRLSSARTAFRSANSDASEDELTIHSRQVKAHMPSAQRTSRRIDLDNQSTEKLTPLRMTASARYTQQSAAKRQSLGLKNSSRSKRCSNAADDDDDYDELA